MEVLLHVQGDEEPHREDRGIEQEDHGIRGSQWTQPEDAQRHERLSGEPPLHERERGKQQDADGHPRQNSRGAPAEHVAANDAVDQRHHPCGDEKSAREVEVAMPEHAPALRNEATSEEDDGQADRHVDEEDRRPAEPLGQHAAQQDAGGGAETAERAPDAESAVAGCPFLERRRDDREARRRDHRAADALDRASAEEAGWGARERAEEGGGGEQGGAREEYSPAPEEVGGPPAEEEQSGERKRVGVDDPLQTGGREPEAVLDRRQRHVHDRDVQDDHELREADEQEERVGVPANVGLGCDHRVQTNASWFVSTTTIVAIVRRSSYTHRRWASITHPPRIWSWRRCCTP